MKTISYKNFITTIEPDFEDGILIGRFNFRVPPFLHNEVATAAAKAGKSLNQWVIETLDQAVHSR